MVYYNILGVVDIRGMGGLILGGVGNRDSQKGPCSGTPTVVFGGNGHAILGKITVGTQTTALKTIDG